MAKLITEICEDLQYITEEKDGKKYLYIEGPYISTEVANRNQRIYKKSLMEPIVENYIKTKIENKTAYGNFGHPAGPKVEEEKISHRITSFKWDGNNVIGRAVVIPEGAGKVLTGIIESGGRLGCSTRGLGSVKPNEKGIQEVQNDYKLVTVDCVAEPSGLDCWVNGILESVDWVFDAATGTFMENRIEQLQKTMKKLSIRELNEKRLNIFKYYLNGISKSPL